MDPLKIFVESSAKLTPSAVEYEVGSEVEIFIYNYLRAVKDYDSIVLISFMDAHRMFFEYLNRVIGDKLEDLEVVTVLSKKGNVESAPLIAGRLGNIFKSKSGKILALILGLDFYAIVFSEKSFLDLYPRIANLTRYNENLNLVTVFNGAIFSQTVSQMIYTFSLNIVKLGIEKFNNELRRYITIIRSAFPEYNLKKWYYEVVLDKIIWSEEQL